VKTRMQIIPVAIIVIVLGLGAYWLVNRASAQEQGLTASGTIEATDVTISPEIGGRVLEVLVTDGDAVSKDQPVVRLDETLLQAQLKQVQANVQAAQAQQRAAQAQQQAAQANYDLLKSGPEEQQIQAAQDAVKTAEANVAGAQAQLAQMLAPPQAADIAAAEAAVAKAASDVTSAQQAYDGVVEGRATAKAYGVPGGGLGTMEEKMRAQLESIKANYDVAVKRLAQLKQGATKDEINQARARVAAAESQAAMAQAQLEQVQKGARTEQLAAAQAQVDAAAAQAASAGAQVEAAQAQASGLQVQIDKLTLRSPLNGVVLQRAIEPGEFVPPGASLITMGDIGNLYITVYIPEDRYGEIKLGQPVTVKVDSFPNETFTAKVTRIADQAEFTPRNVQTAEGRATTVFAVKLAVDSSGGKLKPGMPADVYFDQ
jgi:HlyD family secretion protein